MASERCLIVVHYTGTQVGNHTPCDHLSIITKNHQCNTPKSCPTLTQIIELLLSGEQESHDLFWGRSPVDPLVKHGKVVSLTLFVNDPQSVVDPQKLSGFVQFL
ncbi:MAG: hypothetical protein HWQ38_37940 [Nostoc sp. NMS7]|uniref:hypothetical protein n=1 Tax=Nostoc sp. NMS7 TaxID=2815391 RepID=UPI0025EA3C7E|nr:hypothetical protein [Nostoc sp. NMS7]MBN3951940.1 hypothetical protein [Nostoc sp. NMS7]